MDDLNDDEYIAFLQLQYAKLKQVRKEKQKEEQLIQMRLNKLQLEEQRRVNLLEQTKRQYNSKLNMIIHKTFNEEAKSRFNLSKKESVELKRLHNKESKILIKRKIQENKENKIRKCKEFFNLQRNKYKAFSNSSITRNCTNTSIEVNSSRSCYKNASDTKTKDHYLQHSTKHLQEKKERLKSLIRVKILENGG